LNAGIPHLLSATFAIVSPVASVIKEACDNFEVGSAVAKIFGIAFEAISLVISCIKLNLIV